jgi:hypothetical protein
MGTEIHLVLLLILLAIFLFTWPNIQTIKFGFWLPKPLEEKKAKTPNPLKPKTPDDCPNCREEKPSPAKEAQTRQMHCPWSEVGNRRGRKKTLSTQVAQQQVFSDH